MINVPIISIFFSLASVYICYKPKELIAEIYEMKFQQELIQSSQPDIMGNVKEIKRIDLDIKNKKSKDPKI